MDLNDTIAAIASGRSSSAIALIRVSGKDSLSIGQKLFRSASQKKQELKSAPTQKVFFGEFLEANGNTIDEILVTIFRAPHSYTGENTLEISCHGSPYIQQKILDTLIKNGCRLADPGEFTLRSYLNGKMDLSQAEAVADLIASENEASHKIAMQQMRGGFSEELSTLRQQLIDFTALIELELDFSEEDVAFADRKELSELLKKIQSKLLKLSDSFKYGNAIKEGIPVAILGKPNAGKSSLLNALLKEEKAIVSEIAGTTRDTIEDTLVWEGIKFRFIDTAGLRETDDAIEAIGVERAKATAAKAQVLLFLYTPEDSSVEEVMESIKELYRESLEIILVENKIDLSGGFPRVDFQNRIEKTLVTEGYPFQNIGISVWDERHIDQIKNLLIEFTQNLGNDIETVVSNSRHKRALDLSLESISVVKDGLEKSISGDLLSADLKDTLYHIGSITGEIDVDEDILGSIFSKFCIGK